MVVVRVQFYLTLGQGHLHRFDLHHFEVWLDLLGSSLAVELVLKMLDLLLYVVVCLKTGIREVRGVRELGIEVLLCG